MTIISNKIGGSEAIIRLDSSANIALSELATSNDEVVTEAYVNEVFWSSNNEWTVTRGNTDILVLHNSGNFDLAGSGIALNEEANTDIVVSLGGGSGTIILTVKKKSTFASEY